MGGVIQSSTKFLSPNGEGDSPIPAPPQTSTVSVPMANATAFSKEINSPTNKNSIPPKQSENDFHEEIDASSIQLDVPASSHQQEVCGPNVSSSRNHPQEVKQRHTKNMQPFSRPIKINKEREEKRKQQDPKSQHFHLPAPPPPNGRIPPCYIPPCYHSSHPTAPGYANYPIHPYGYPQSYVQPYGDPRRQPYPPKPPPVPGLKPPPPQIALARKKQDHAVQALPPTARLDSSSAMKCPPKENVQVAAAARSVFFSAEQNQEGTREGKRVATGPPRDGVSATVKQRPTLTTGEAASKYGDATANKRSKDDSSRSIPPPIDYVSVTGKQRPTLATGEPASEYGDAAANKRSKDDSSRSIPPPIQGISVTGKQRPTPAAGEAVSKRGEAVANEQRKNDSPLAIRVAATKTSRNHSAARVVTRKEAPTTKYSAPSDPRMEDELKPTPHRYPPPAQQRGTGGRGYVSPTSKSLTEFSGGLCAKGKEAPASNGSATSTQEVDNEPKLSPSRKHPHAPEQGIVGRNSVVSKHATLTKFIGDLSDAPRPDTDKRAANVTSMINTTARDRGTVLHIPQENGKQPHKAKSAAFTLSFSRTADGAAGSSANREMIELSSDDDDDDDDTIYRKSAKTSRLPDVVIDLSDSEPNSESSTRFDRQSNPDEASIDEVVEEEPRQKKQRLESKLGKPTPMGSASASMASPIRLGRDRSEAIDVDNPGSVEDDLNGKPPARQTPDEASVDEVSEEEPRQKKQRLGRLAGSPPPMDTASVEIDLNGEPTARQMPEWKCDLNRKPAARRMPEYERMECEPPAREVPENERMEWYLDSKPPARKMSVDSDSGSECEIVQCDQDSKPAAREVPLESFGQPKISTVCSIDEFCDLWKRAEQIIGAAEDIERGGLIRRGNRALESKAQSTAQYGRIHFPAMENLFDTLDLKESDIFLDIGHGIGNTVLQAAHTRNCHARGIEIDDGRFTCSMAYKETLYDVRSFLETDHHIYYRVGCINLRQGGLQDASNKDFLTKGGCIKAFCNNFGGVFGDKSMRLSTNYTLDDHIAGVFPSMAPGSVLVTLERPNFMVPAQDDILAARRRAGLPHIENAGFYEVEQIKLGVLAGSVTWASDGNKKDMTVYKYTRINGGSFLCWNPKCENAQGGISVAASRLDTASNGWVPNSCSCGAYSLMALRERRQQTRMYDPYYETLRPQFRKGTRVAKRGKGAEIEKQNPEDAEDSNSDHVDEEFISDSQSSSDSSEDDSQVEPLNEAPDNTNEDVNEPEEVRARWTWAEINDLPEASLSDPSADTFQQFWDVFENDIVRGGAEGSLYAEAKEMFPDSERLTHISSTPGCLLPPATEKVLDSCELDPSRDIFVDFGHGLGAVALQASFTRSCSVRGIEVHPDRHATSVAYFVGFKRIKEIYNRRFPGSSFPMGEVDLRHGRYEDTAQIEFLTRGGRIKAFCNNYGNICGYKRRGKSCNTSVNLCGLFGLMPEESILITLHKLDLNVPPQTKIEEERQRAGLPHVEAAGFYEVEEISLGRECDSVSWAACFNDKELIAYKYTRVNAGSFICWNPGCDNAKSATQIPASKIMGDNEKVCVPNACSCGSRSLMSLRRRR